MAEHSKILEGVFAIKKPPYLSSAQVLRDLQNKFAISKTFEPHLQEKERKEYEQARFQPNHKRRRRTNDNDSRFKMGHGGTLDPLATGVLIVGIGRGTKHLNNFLSCTKTYETVVLFGKSTDTYDVAGKIVAEAPYEHITKDMVEKKLANFRGDIKQVPPIYSALKIQGMKAYEYARSGKELPRELEARPMTVDECTLLEWYEGGKHEYRWPATEADEVEKQTLRKLMRVANQTPDSPIKSTANIVDAKDDGTVSSAEHSKSHPEPTAKPATINSLDPVEKAALHTHELPPLSSEPAEAPAARVRLTSSSGFYVRSFTHDLGIACDSFATMPELTRTRQGDYTCIQPAPERLIPCLTYNDLDEGEDCWGPKITSVLEKWMQDHSESSGNEGDRRQNIPRQWTTTGRGSSRGDGRSNKRSWDQRNTGGDGRRRNSSSPES